MIKKGTELQNIDEDFPVNVIYYTTYANRVIFDSYSSIFSRSNFELIAKCFFLLITATANFLVNANTVKYMSHD